jgi:nucleoside-diphosphate-sugar epimerase
MNIAVVLGAGGFIGSHLVTRLQHEEGLEVVGVDRKRPDFSPSSTDDFRLGDLRDLAFCRDVIPPGADEVYQLAADMGGAGFIFSGENDADIMHDSALINLNVLQVCRERRVRRIFYASSACIYPAFNQLDPTSPVLEESSAYPAQPDSEYGWEKLFSERLFQATARNHGLEVRIARYHNVFGPEGTWQGGREKAPAALCRKIAETPDGGEIEIWGDGEQTRSFLYIDECLEGTLRLMRSPVSTPLNIGSEEMISINDLAALIMRLAEKQQSLRHIDGPIGVRGRRSDNRLIQKNLDWSPSWPLEKGLAPTYAWIADRVAESSPASR